MQTWGEVKLRFLTVACTECGVLFYAPKSLRLIPGFQHRYDFDCPVCRLLNPRSPMREVLVREDPSHE